MADSSTSVSLSKAAEKRVVTQPAAISLANIKPSDIGNPIHVKVYRRWTVTSTKGAKQSALCFILLDQQGGAIEANVGTLEKAHFDNTLQMNETYTITGFGMRETKKWMQTLPNRLILILGKFTDVKPFPDTGFPKHHFNFAAYNELPSRADKNEAILTDYIGFVHHVGDVRDLGNPTQKMVVWRDIMLRNLQNETVRFTLWSDRAKNFDTDEYERAAKPTVMAVSSCWVKNYGGLQLSSTPATFYYLNPDIPETDFILAMYDQVFEPPAIQNVRTYRYENIEQEKMRNRVTLDELVRENPLNQTNVRFTVIATILEIDNRRPWYFRRCRVCNQKIFPKFPHAHCAASSSETSDDYSYSFRASITDDSTVTLTCFSDEVHSLVTKCNKVVQEEGHTDPYRIPPVLQALEGTTHLFQLHFDPESTQEYRNFILDTVMDSGPQLLQLPKPADVFTVPETFPESQQLLLTAPESNSADMATASASASTPPQAPMQSEIPETSTPVPEEYRKSANEPIAKTSPKKTTVRKQLIKDNEQAPPPESTKKTKHAH